MFQPAGTSCHRRLRELPITCSHNLALKLSARPHTLPVKFPLSRAQAHMTPSLRATKCLPCTPSQWLILLLTVDTLKLLRMCLLGRKLTSLTWIYLSVCLSTCITHSSYEFHWSPCPLISDPIIIIIFRPFCWLGALNSRVEIELMCHLVISYTLCVCVVMYCPNT